MPLNDSFPKTVAFVVGVRLDPTTGVAAQRPIGTAFLVSVPATVDGYTFTYAVTARHVVACETQGTWLRMNRPEGGWEDVSVPGWINHPTADVAIAPLRNRERFDILTVPLHMFADRVSVRPSLGDPVFFIGLLTPSDLADANVPIVRSGTLAAIYQPSIAMLDCDRTVVRHEAHLIDCRSYSGFSGSPCFVEFRVPLKDSMNKGPRADIVLGDRSIMPEVLCFGLISGHFDGYGEGLTTGGDKVSFPINTGVGVATPIERIRECLMDQDVVVQRADEEQRLARQIEEEKKRQAAVPDSIPERMSGGAIG